MTTKKKKRKTHQYHIFLNDIDNKKLLMLAGENYGFTEIIEEAIRGKYFSTYKTNNIPMELTPEQKELQQIAKINWLEGDSNE